MCSWQQIIWNNIVIYFLSLSKLRVFKNKDCIKKTARILLHHHWFSRLRNKWRNSLLMMSHHTTVGFPLINLSALKICFNKSEALSRCARCGVVSCHQYGNFCVHSSVVNHWKMLAGFSGLRSGCCIFSHLQIVRYSSLFKCYGWKTVAPVGQHFL